MSTEAMKLARDALEETYAMSHRVEGMKNRAMIALQQALAQPQHEPVGSLSVRYHRGCKSMTNTDFDYNGDLPEGDYELYTSPPAQPQQEPVAWANPNDLQNFDLKVRTNGGPLHTVPLYTSPPAQEFVCSTGLCHYRKPLTDEDITYLWAHIPEPSLRKALNIFARAVEAAHGIKGGA